MTDTERGAAALKLWREWITTDDFNPLATQDETGEEWCIFCGESQMPRTKVYHAADCVYIRARKLVEESDNG